MVDRQAAYAVTSYKRYVKSFVRAVSSVFAVLTMMRCGGLDQTRLCNTRLER